MAKNEIPDFKFQDGGPLFTTIPDLASWLSTAKVRAAFLVVQNDDGDQTLRVLATNNDKRFQPNLAFALMRYLEMYFDASGDREALRPRADRRRSTRRK